MLQLLLADYIDILMICESKLDSTFPSSQFQIYSFRTPYRLDRTDRGGGTLLFVRENLITRLLSRHSFPHDIEILLIELNLRKKKWLICCCYNPRKNLINYHLQELTKGIQIYSKNYYDILLMGDFNAEVFETSFSSFYELYEVKSIINQSTCYKNPTNPSCMDLFLTNSPNSFQKPTVVETGLSDFHKLIATVVKSYSPKRTPNIITYRKYTNFDKEKFIDEISFNLPKHNLQELTLEAFISMFKIVFEKHVPLKKKYLRAI